MENARHVACHIPRYPTQFLAELLLARHIIVQTQLRCYFKQLVPYLWLMEDLWSETTVGVNSRFAVMTEEEILQILTLLEFVVLSPSLYMYILC